MVELSALHGVEYRIVRENPGFSRTIRYSTLSLKSEPCDQITWLTFALPPHLKLHKHINRLIIRQRFQVDGQAVAGRMMLPGSGNGAKEYAFGLSGNGA